jgi:hypothetical protein
MFERVYTVHDYYDGPRSGVADYAGRPHHYSCGWDEAADDYAESFALVAIDEGLLHVALEQWRIWKEWEAAFYRGERDRDSHPALPGQDARYAELDREFQVKLAALPVSLHARAMFRVRPEQEGLPRGVIREMEVEWTPCSPTTRS